MPAAARPLPDSGSLLLRGRATSPSRQVIRDNEHCLLFRWFRVLWGKVREPGDCARQKVNGESGADDASDDPRPQIDSGPEPVQKQCRDNPKPQQRRQEQPEGGDQHQQGQAEPAGFSAQLAHGRRNCLACAERSTSKFRPTTPRCSRSPKARGGCFHGAERVPVKRCFLDRARWSRSVKPPSLSNAAARESIWRSRSAHATLMRVSAAFAAVGVA
jgi:hypothetical protein